MNKTISKYAIYLIIAASLAFKFGLFGYTLIKAPDSKFMPDTATYIDPGMILIEKGVFATFSDDGEIIYETNRTPGYPVFIAVLNKVFKIPFNGIIIIQILLITFAGYFVYLAANEVDARIGLLAAFIFLFDQPTTISALMLLTEALYTVFIALFMYFFLKYLKNYRAGYLFLSTSILALATYIRPVSYYLGICLAAGVVYALFRSDLKKALLHGLILLTLFFSIIGPWHYRNYARTGNADFTVIDDQDLRHMGLTNNYSRYKESRQIDAHPFVYYTEQTIRSTVQFFTLPGTFKYLQYRPLKVASKIFGYPWMVFWLAGLLFAGLDKMPKKFLASTVIYFALVSIFVTGLCVGSRFRVPVMPLIAVLSACGWVRISKWLYLRLRPGSGP